METGYDNNICQSNQAGISSEENDELPDEIVLKTDYSCYCKVCNCTLSRIKDAIQHASGKRHKKACKIAKETESKSTKRGAVDDYEDDAKKPKTEEETKEEEEAKKMLAKVFDETFHSGVVALKDNYYCKVCRCMIGNNRKNVNQHKEGKSHKMALEKFKKALLSGTIGSDIPVEDPNQPFEGDGYIEKIKNAKRKTTYYCKICDFRTKDREAITEHMNGEQHQANVSIEKGTQQEYYRETERFGSRRPFDAEPYFNKQDVPFHGDYQNDNHDVWNHDYKNSTSPMNPDALMISQMRTNQQADGFFPQYHQASNPFIPYPQQSPAPFIPHSQQTSVPFMPHPQMTPVSFMPQSSQIPFPDNSQLQQPHNLSQSQPDALPISSAPPSEQKANSVEPANNPVSGDLLGFISNENDAEVVMDVINSLLHTYIKYRLQALPGSFMKLLRKSSKVEDSVTRINKLATGKTAKQIFINTQNHKNKIQSTIPDEKRLSSPALYERHSENRSLKTKAVNKPSSCSEGISKSYSSYDIPEIRNETNDSYDRRSYIEDQIKKAIATRSMRRSQNDDSCSSKASIDDLFKQYRGNITTNNQEKVLKNAKQNEQSVADFSKRYTNSGNDGISSRPNENSINDLFVQYRSSNKEINSAKNIREIEDSATESFSQYRNSVHGSSSQEIKKTDLDLFRQYRSKEEISPYARKNELPGTDFSNRYKSFNFDDRSSTTVYSQRNIDIRNENSSLRNTQSSLDRFKKYRSFDRYSH